MGASRTSSPSCPKAWSRGPAWSPDGRYIAFSARPGASPEFPAKPYRVTRHVYRLDGAGYLHAAAPDLWVVAAGGGELRNLTRDEAYNCYRTGPVWSPDSREILFTTACFPDSYRWFAALRAVNLEGEVRDVVKDWGCATNPPSAGWTPDGNCIVFVGNPDRRAQAEPQAPVGWLTGRAERPNAARQESSTTWQASSSQTCRSSAPTLPICTSPRTGIMPTCLSRLAVRSRSTASRSAARLTTNRSSAVSGCAMWQV